MRDAAFAQGAGRPDQVVVQAGLSHRGCELYQRSAVQRLGAEVEGQSRPAEAIDQQASRPC